MAVLIDNSKAVEVPIREWDEVGMQYGPDWSNDFLRLVLWSLLMVWMMLILWMMLIIVLRRRMI